MGGSDMLLGLFGVLLTRRCISAPRMSVRGTRGKFGGLHGADGEREVRAVVFWSQSSSHGCAWRCDQDCGGRERGERGQDNQAIGVHVPEVERRRDGRAVDVEVSVAVANE